MRVLVLGGSGFLGPHIVQRLLERGHDVAVFHRGTQQVSVPGIRQITGDRNDLASSAQAFGDLKPDVVVDLVAFTSQQAEALVGAFRGIAGRVVVLSSGDVYRGYDVIYGRIAGPVEPTPFKESTTLRENLFPYRGSPIPVDYGFSWDAYEKILVENTVLGQSDIPATVLRLPMVYGPGARYMTQRRFLAYSKRMRDKRPAILLDERTAEWRAPWGYVRDVAEAIRLVVESDRAAGEIYNVGEAESLDLAGWILELGTSVGWPGELVKVDQACPPPSLPRQLNLKQHLDMDSTKIREQLGYGETITRQEALSITAEWDSANAPEAVDGSLFDYSAEDAILRR